MSAAALITRLSTLTHDLRGRSPVSICFMFLSIVVISCPHLDRLLPHKKSILSSKPEVTGGHKGVMGVRAVPSQGRPQQCCKLPTEALWRCIVTEKRRRETFVGWHFIAIVVTLLLYILGQTPPRFGKTLLGEGVGRQ